MKARLGHVSNSSSSSFIISKKFISAYILEAVVDPVNMWEGIAKDKWDEDENGIHDDYDDYAAYKEYVKNEIMLYADTDPWWISEKSSGVISASCTMDNFDYHSYLVWLGVPSKAIEYI